MKKSRSIVVLIGLVVFMVGCAGDFDDEFSAPDSDDSNGSEISIDEADVDEGEPLADQAGGEVDTAVVNPTLAIVSVPATFHPAFQMFNQYVNVFGVRIFATAGVAPDKTKHAASVMAQYLDNDEDGIADNKRLIEALVAHEASFVMFSEEGDPLEDEFFDIAEPLFDRGVAMQNLYAVETLPNGRAQGEFDATLEEVLHLITHGGYHYAYPDVWGEEPGTAVADAMDKARGGRFTAIPRSYPDGAWYTYDDNTCEYNCMISEYIYWAHTSILGAQDWRFDEIGHEWRLNTAEKVRTTDPAIYALLTDPEYRFATTLPDGNYQGIAPAVGSGGDANQESGSDVEDGDSALPNTIEALEARLMMELGYDDLDSLFDHLDSLSDEEFDLLIAETLGLSISETQQYLDRLFDEG